MLRNMAGDKPAGTEVQTEEDTHQDCAIRRRDISRAIAEGRIVQVMFQHRIQQDGHK